MGVRECQISKRYIAREGTFWRKVIDAKYNTRNPNVLCCHDSHPSQFWKGVVWAMQAVKSGYKWHVGNGRSVRFGEDIWFGNSPLATQFWDIYCVVNETNKTV